MDSLKQFNIIDCHANKSARNDEKQTDCHCVLSPLSLRGEAEAIYNPSNPKTFNGETLDNGLPQPFYKGFAMTRANPSLRGV